MSRAGETECEAVDFSAVAVSFRTVVDGAVIYEGDDMEKAREWRHQARHLGHDSHSERALATWEPWA